MLWDANANLSYKQFNSGKRCHKRKTDVNKMIWCFAYCIASLLGTAHSNIERCPYIQRKALLHQSSIRPILLLHLLVLLDIVSELVHLTLFVLGLLLSTLLLLALSTGLAVFAAFAFLAMVAVVVEDALHEVLLVVFCGNELATGRGGRGITGHVGGWMEPTLRHFVWY